MRMMNKRRGKKVGKTRAHAHRITYVQKVGVEYNRRELYGHRREIWTAGALTADEIHNDLCRRYKFREFGT